MAIGTNVHLELPWQGNDPDDKDQDKSRINRKMEGAAHLVYTNMDKSGSAQKVNQAAAQKGQAEEIGSLSSTLMKLGRMTKAAALPDQELAQVETPTLQKQLEQTHEKLIQARLSFDRACQSGDQALMTSEERVKQQLLEEALSLQRALQERGIVQNTPASQECVIS
jgi:hypothetical protein